MKKLFAASIVLLFCILIIGCSKQETTQSNSTLTTKTTKIVKAQCEDDANCTVLLIKSLTKCQAAYCDAGTCKKKTLANCCGNGVNDTLEDGLPGNKCNCPADYGNCTGNLQYESATGRMTSAKYIQYACVSSLISIPKTTLGINNTNKTVYIVPQVCDGVYDDAAQRSSQYFNAFTGPGFTINFYANYDNPFYKNTSTIQIEMKLNEFDDTKIKAPISFTEIRFMEGKNVLYRIPTPKIFLKTIGQSEYAVITLKNYDFIYPEEAKSVSFSIDYEYTPLKMVDGSLVAQDKQRNIYQTMLSERITFLDKTLIKS